MIRGRNRKYLEWCTPAYRSRKGARGLALEIVRAWQYCLFVFVAVMGLLQLVAIVNGLKGMLFIRNKPVTVLLSAAAVVFAFWWFFYRDDRVNTAMRRTGLEGAQQFTVFCWTTFAALVLTLVLASLHQPAGLPPRDGERPGGADRRSISAEVRELV